MNSVGTVKRLWDGQPRNCGWITNTSCRFSYTLNSQYNSRAHPAPYSMDSHRSFSGDKVVGASSSPLTSISYTMLESLKLCIKLRACLTVDHRHSSARKMQNAGGQPVMVSPCILSCTRACISSADSQHNLGSKHSQCASPCRLPWRHLHILFPEQLNTFPVHINPPALPRSYTTSTAFKPRTCNRLFWPRILLSTSPFSCYT